MSKKFFTLPKPSYQDSKQFLKKILGCEKIEKCDPEDRFEYKDLRAFENLDLNVQLFVLDFLKSKMFFEKLCEILLISKQEMCQMHSFEIFEQISNLKDEQLESLNKLIDEYNRRKM